MRQSNRTDADSAKLATGKGVIQGYTGVAAVDSQHQIIVGADPEERTRSLGCSRGVRGQIPLVVHGAHVVEA